MEIADGYVHKVKSMNAFFLDKTKRANKKLYAIKFWNFFLRIEKKSYASI